MIQLSAFADEASSCFKEQIEALQKNGIPYIELRGLDGKNIASVSLEKAKEYAAQLKEAGIAVWSIGSPIGKVRLSDDLKAHMDSLRHICALANIFETKRVRMFSFFEAYEDAEKVKKALNEMVAIAAEYGVLLCHENEKAIYGDTADRVEELLDAVPGMRCVYDPANFLEVGEDAADTLSRLHGRADYFHIKDVVSETGELVPAGYGDGRILELIARIDPQKTVVLTLEPHLAIFEGYAEIDGTVMKNKFHFENNREAFDAAADALKACLQMQGYTETKGGYIK